MDNYTDLNNLDITDLAYEIVSEKFPEFGSRKKETISLFAVQNILKLPYYCDLYKESYFSITGGKGNLSFFDNDLNDIIRQKMNNYNPDFSKCSSVALSQNKIDVCEQMINTYMLSSNVREYFEKLNGLYNNDLKFKDNIQSLTGFFNSYENNLLLEEYLKYRRLYDRLNSGKEEKNKKYIEGEIEDNFRDLLELKFIKTKDVTPETLMKFKKSLISEEQFLIKYKKEIKVIMEELKELRPFLFEKPNNENITYEFFEINPTQVYDKENDYYVNYFVDEKDSVFKESVLNSVGVKRSPIAVNVENKYMPTFFYSHIRSQYNEISCETNGDYYGLKYLSSDTFDRHNRSAFITASKNNEIIGIVAFCANKKNLKSGVHNSILSVVKHNYRGMGVASELYNKLSMVFDKQGMVFVNTYYTDNGRERLKHKKEVLNEKFENCFFLDTDIDNSKSIEKSINLEYMSKKLATLIATLDNENKLIGNAGIIKRHFSQCKDELRDKVNSGEYISVDESVQKIERHFELAKKEIELKHNKNLHSKCRL